MNDISKEDLEFLENMPLDPDAGGQVHESVRISDTKNDINDAPLFFLVLQYKPNKKEKWNFEIQGIFSSKKKAINACRDRNYSYMPLKLDELLPHETGKDTNVYPMQ